MSTAIMTKMTTSPMSRANPHVGESSTRLGAHEHKKGTGRRRAAQRFQIEMKTRHLRECADDVKAGHSEDRRQDHSRNVAFGLVRLLSQVGRRLESCQEQHAAGRRERRPMSID